MSREELRETLRRDGPASALGELRVALEHAVETVVAAHGRDADASIMARVCRRLQDEAGTGTCSLHSLWCLNILGRSMAHEHSITKMNDGGDVFILYIYIILCRFGVKDEIVSKVE